MSRRNSNPIENDPVVAEVRRARAALWRKGGSTPEGFSRVAKAGTKSRPRSAPAIKPARRPGSPRRGKAA